MPIVNLTTNVEDKLPILGKLHKGDKKTESNRPGKDLEYFRIEFQPEFEHLREDWTELYGPKPEGFDNVFMSHATADDAFSSWMEEWNASQTLLHRCDSEYQTLWFNQATQDYGTAKIQCASKSNHPCACNHVGRLNLLLTDFVSVTGMMGYITLETHSINDILTLYQTLRAVQRINSTLLGIPFILGRSNKKISAPKTDKATGHRTGRMKITKSLFYLYVDPEFAKGTLMPRLAASGGFFSADQPLLPAPIPQIQAGEAKGLLNSGSGQRRLGATSKTGLATEPPKAETPAPESPTPTTEPAKPAVQGTIIGVDTVGSHLGKLKTRALAEIFNKDIRAMNECVSKLMQEGKLPPEMPIDQALDVIKAANCPTPVAPTAPKDETIIDPLSKYEGQAVALDTVRKDKYVNGAPMWTGFCNGSNGERVEVVLYPEDVTAIRDAGHSFPQTDASVYIPLILTVKNNEIRINPVKIEPHERKRSPFGKPQPAQAEKDAQAQYEALPGVNETVKQIDFMS